MHPIARRRIAKGLTQTQLAELVGVSLTAVQGWERGRQPRPKHVAKLAEIFGADALELLDEISQGQVAATA